MSALGPAMPLAVRRSGRARHIGLTIHPVDGPVLVLPVGAPLEAGLRFAREKEAWLRDRSARRPPGVAYRFGASFPLRGETVTIRQGEDRSATRCVGGDLWICCDAAGLPRRLEGWLRDEARRDLTAAVSARSRRLGVSASGITLRDTVSRWGSCSAKGRLSFSWRLVLAPPFVLDYVAAHEVAHLREMNHSRAFWTLVEQLDPDWRRARDWLRRNGNALHVVGREG